MKKYPKPNGWVTPVRKGYRMQCCDCGLVHAIDFRVKDGKIQFRVERHFRATAGVRAGRVRKCPVVIARGYSIIVRKRRGLEV